MKIVYKYKGPVFLFDKCINDNWTSETTAETRSEAIRNLTFKAKKDHNLEVNTRVSLPGTLIYGSGERRT